MKNRMESEKIYKYNYKKWLLKYIIISIFCLLYIILIRCPFIYDIKKLANSFISNQSLIPSYQTKNNIQRKFKIVSITYSNTIIQFSYEMIFSLVIVIAFKVFLRV